MMNYDREGFQLFCVCFCLFILIDGRFFTYNGPYAGFRLISKNFSCKTERFICRLYGYN